MVAKLNEYRARDTVETLETLLKLARAGRIVGIVVGWQFDSGVYRTTTTGLFARNQIAALGAVGKLFVKVGEIEK